MINKRTYPVRSELIRKLRELKGMSVEQLADQSDVSVKAIQRMLNGGSKSFLKNIHAVAEVLGVSSDSLRADIDLVTPKTTDFTLNVTIKGNIENAGQLANLLTLSPSIMRNLAAAGITVNGHQSQLEVFEKSNDETKRVIVFITGTLTNASPFYVFVAVKPHKYRAFRESQENKRLDLKNFDEYGEIIVSDDVAYPTPDVLQKLADMYETTVENLMDLSDAPEL